LFTLSEYNKIVHTAPKDDDAKDNSSDSEVDDDNSAMIPFEDIEALQMNSQDGVYYNDKGVVVVQLYALVDGLKLKQVYVRKKLQEENPKRKFGFLDRFWRAFVNYFKPQVNS